MRKTEREQMYKDIEQHGKNLNAIFNTNLDPVKLCKKLHSLEIKAHEITTKLCNGDYTTEYPLETSLSVILDKTKDLLRTFATRESGVIGDAIFINRDPRGYALKIKDSVVKDNNLDIYRDWGGYGIIAPDFTPCHV